MAHHNTFESELGRAEANSNSFEDPIMAPASSEVGTR